MTKLKLDNPRCPHCCAEVTFRLGTTYSGYQKYRCKQCKRAWQSEYKRGMRVRKPVLLHNPLEVIENESL